MEAVMLCLQGKASCQEKAGDEDGDVDGDGAEEGGKSSAKNP